MRKIKLTKGKYALVDNKDFNWLSQWKWYAVYYGYTYYAVRSIYLSSGQYRTILMHRMILGLEYKDGKHTDHLNHNGLDNRRYNIRACTQAQNNFNKRNTRGCCWHKRDKKWCSQIRIKGKLIHLGSFDNEEDARKAYLCAKQKYHKIN